MIASQMRLVSSSLGVRAPAEWEDPTANVARAPTSVRSWRGSLLDEIELVESCGRQQVCLLPYARTPLCSLAHLNTTCLSNSRQLPQGTPVPCRVVAMYGACELPGCRRLVKEHHAACIADRWRQLLYGVRMSPNVIFSPTLNTPPQPTRHQGASSVTGRRVSKGCICSQPVRWQQTCEHDGVHSF